MAQKTIHFKHGATSSSMSEGCPFAFEAVLKYYFATAGCHRQALRGRTANFYSSSNFPNYKNVLEITGPPAHSAFYEYQSAFPVRSATSPNIMIKYNGEFAGILEVSSQPGNARLIATDWTHHISFIPIISHIISKLETEGLLIRTTPENPSPLEALRKHNITVGCDPEFELTKFGSVVSARSIFGNHIVNNSFGNVGIDGAGAQIEIRPKPGKADDVVNNIRRLLQAFSSRHKSYKLAASSDRYPCGGHIHVGVSPLPNQDFWPKLVEVLNDFIGHPTRALNGGRRRDSGYGSMGDYHRPSHGLEYRTPPGAVFRNPGFAKIVLQLAENLTAKLANTHKLHYNYPVTKQDLVEVGGLTEEEANLYLEECGKQPPRDSENLLAAWIQDVATGPIIDFIDTWHPLITASLEKVIAKHCGDSNVTIILYGLRGSRGEVFTFSVPNSEEIEHPNPKPEWKGAYVFGFAKSFRKKEMEPERLNEIVRAFEAALEVVPRRIGLLEKILRKI